MKSTHHHISIILPRIGLCVCLLLNASCDFIHIKKKTASTQKGAVPVARVYDSYLSVSDIKAIIPESISRQDRGIWIKNYIDGWVKRQLFMNEAVKQVDGSDINIEKKVNDYRNSLIEYQFRKLYVQKNLKDSVSENEIQDYYNDHQQSFVLKHDIIKGTYVKAPINAPDIAGLKTLIYAKSDEEKHRLASYCLRFSTLYHLNDLTWVDFNKLIRGSPMSEISDKMLFLQQHEYYETKVADFVFFLKVDAYKLAGGISPLEFVREDIKALIINKRKAELVQKQELDIYKNAVKGQDFEYYSR